jgi:hypothetical protein
MHYLNSFSDPKHASPHLSLSNKNFLCALTTSVFVSQNIDRLDKTSDAYDIDPFFRKF